LDTKGCERQGLPSSAFVKSTRKLNKTNPSIQKWIEFEAIVRGFVLAVVFLLVCCASARAQLFLPCYSGFEVSRACITERGLDQKVALYQRKITEGMWKLGASYKIDLRIVNNPVEAGYDATVGDVFTEVVRDKEMRNESFIINVTSLFLERQPEILFEASSLHEVCHVMNDDLSGYRRNFANPEVAEEYCVLLVVGEARYTEYLQAYALYQHWDSLTYESFLARVKNVKLVPAPREMDEADTIVLEYLKKHADGKEHLLVYNGELHDVTLHATRDKVWHDPDKLKAVILAGKPLIFFHNHPAEAGTAAMFPSYDDFGVAALFSFMAYVESPDRAIEFRVVQAGDESTVVSYGFKQKALDDIKKVALDYRDALAHEADVAQIKLSQQLLDYHLAQDSFSDYLQYACPVDLSHRDAEVCRTHPKYFLWPSDRFFIHYRPQ
jgi:hypothetical protein